MEWIFDEKTPVFIQIASKVRNGITLGRYMPGEQIPTVRQLASEAAVNPNTVQKAMLLLEEEELLVSKATVGLFVTSDTSVIEAARQKEKKDTVQRLVSEARFIVITTEELIRIIKEDYISE